MYVYIIWLETVSRASCEEYLASLCVYLMAVYARWMRSQLIKTLCILTVDACMLLFDAVACRQLRN